MRDEDYTFWDLYKAAFQEAQDLTKDRMPQYVGDESILDFWIHGQNDLVYEINKKMIRLRRQLKTDKPCETTDRIDDTIIDMINYLAFLKAYRDGLGTPEDA